MAAATVAVAVAVEDSSNIAPVPLDHVGCDLKVAACSHNSDGGDRPEEVAEAAAADFGLCAICLSQIELQETALVKGCEHAYCVTCILRWAAYKEKPVCPQCKNPFEFLSIHRSLDGCIHDYLFEESVCLLLRASWFVPVEVQPHEEALDELDEFLLYDEYDIGREDLDDEEEEAYYFSRSPSIRIGNRRWGDNGYVSAGRREARPVAVSRQVVDDLDGGSSSSSASKKKDALASKAVIGRRAKRAQKREAADKAAAAKHEQHLERLGLKK